MRPYMIQLMTKGYGQQGSMSSDSINKNPRELEALFELVSEKLQPPLKSNENNQQIALALRSVIKEKM